MLIFFNNLSADTTATILGAINDLRINSKALNPSKGDIAKRSALAVGFVLGLAGAQRLDQMIGLRDPSNCGTNKMCLYSHEWPESADAGVMVNEELDSIGENNLHVQLMDAEENAVFYLASPCRADLSVSKEQCKCESFYDDDYVYVTVVIQQWNWDEYPDLSDFTFGLLWAMMYTPEYEAMESYTVELKLPVPDNYVDDLDYDVFGYPGGFSFEYAGDNYNIGANEVVLDPSEYELALRSMTSEELKDWYDRNSIDGLDPISGAMEYRLASFTYNNYDPVSMTAFKNCVKGNWWEFWDQEDDFDCIKISAEEYGGDGANFCYEPDWDDASKAEAAIFVAETTVGVAAALVTAPESGGALSLPAYCLGSMGVSTAGAWILADQMAEDKWPNGINQK